MRPQEGCPKHTVTGSCGGVVGVNRSGLGSARGYEYAVTAEAELARRIRAEHAA